MTVPYSQRRVTLSNGVTMPMVGYGTYKSTDGGDESAIRQALLCGYRLLDTAAVYQNETQVGQALRESGLAREDVFLTSKVWKTELGYDSTLRAFEDTLRRLGTDYLDLYLLHWPKPDPAFIDWQTLDRESWRALETLYRAGRVRAIGLSNFLPHHIESLLETAQILPMVNQLELHVGYTQEAAVQYCREKHIQVQAWSPLGRTRIMAEPLVTALADKYGVTPAQLLLLFLLEQDICVIPKTTSPARMEQNLHLPTVTWDKADLYALRCLPQLGWGGEHPDRERVR